MALTGETWYALALASIFIAPFVICLIAAPWLVRAGRRGRAAGVAPDALTTSDEVFNPEASAAETSPEVPTALTMTDPSPGDAVLLAGRIRLDG